MIVAGFGFRASAEVASLQDALSGASGAREINHVATLATKADTEVFRAFVSGVDRPAISVTHETAMAQVTITQSGASRAAHQLGSVAEATALAAAGPGARLLGPRTVSSDGMATCALAEGGGS